ALPGEALCHAAGPVRLLGPQYHAVTGVYALVVVHIPQADLALVLLVYLGFLLGLPDAYLFIIVVYGNGLANEPAVARIVPAAIAQGKYLFPVNEEVKVRAPVKAVGIIYN